MKNLFLERLIEIREIFDISYREMDRRSDLPEGTISNAIKRDTNLGISYVINICQAFPEVSEQWLLGMNVPMLKSEISKAMDEPQTHYNPQSTLEKGVLECLKTKEGKEIIKSIVKEMTQKGHSDIDN